jgi:hypothetical protein
MGLDLHVMPLWRAFSGDFTGPVEHLFAQMDVSEHYHRVGVLKGNAEHEKAREMVEAVRLDLAQRGGVDLSWKDEGRVVESVQMPTWGLVALKAYAAHHERSPREAFTVPDEGQDLSKHPDLGPIYGGRETRFAHLILHSGDSGYYLPCDFAHPILNPDKTEERKTDLKSYTSPWPPWLWLAWRRFKLRCGWGGFLDLLALATAERYANPLESELASDRTGSSIRLLAELQELKHVLSMERDYGELRDGEKLAEEDDPLAQVKTGWSLLHFVARRSVDSSLPIVFDG